MPPNYAEQIIDRLPLSDREVKWLRRLHNCEFPKKEFTIAGYAIRWLETSEIENFGAGAEICKDFFPEEVLDSLARAGGWFLEKTTEAITGDHEYSDIDWDAHFDPKPPSRVENYVSRPIVINSNVVLGGGPTIAAGVTRDSSEILSQDYLTPLLILSLYNDRFFEITSVFLAEPGWQTYWLYRNEKNPRFGEPAPYQVSDWSKFEYFIQKCEAALPGALRWQRLRDAIRRYLRATFPNARPIPGWVEFREVRSKALALIANPEPI